MHFFTFLKIQTKTAKTKTFAHFKNFREEKNQFKLLDSTQQQGNSIGDYKRCVQTTTTTAQHIYQYRNMWSVLKLITKYNNMYRLYICTRNIMQTQTTAFITERQKHHFSNTIREYH